jgi:glycolate oxidase iron-sulfur subunit
MVHSPTASPFSGLEIPDEEKYLYCIRCGLCLSACPLYRESLQETDSPRARVVLLRKVVDGAIPISHKLTDQMYRCLDCQACNAICPVGIRPADLALQARYLIHQARPQPWIKPLIFRGYFPHVRLMELSMLPMLAYQRLGLQKLANGLKLTRLLPAQLRDAERMLPTVPAQALRHRLLEITPARGQRQYRVGFFLGCFQNLIFAEGSAATVRVLAENGCEVVTPKQVKCCGMPQIGYGDMEEARALARHNIDLLEKLDVDVIVTDCATCGSTLKEYGATILARDPEYADRARALSQRVRDVAEFLASIPLREPKHSLHVKVTYHDPCHLRRGQNVWRQPRQLLQLAGCEFAEMKEPDWCCGSAGTQALTHHGTSMQILSRKMSNAADTDAPVIATGCPGCQLQLGLGVQRAGLEAQVVHPVQVLDWAYRMDDQD